MPLRARAGAEAGLALQNVRRSLLETSDLRPEPMTDFAPESAFAPSSHVPQMVWGSDSDGSFEPPPPAQPAPRSAAALATATNQLLEALVAKRVPRIDVLRRRLQEALPADLPTVHDAVQQLQAGMEALDFLAARDGERLPLFLRGGEAVVAASARLAGLGTTLAQAHVTDLPVVRLVWIEMVLESDSLRKRVRQGANWIAQMNRDLASRRAAATLDVTRQALDELGKRGSALHRRLQLVHRLCGHARGIHALCEQLLEQRSGLCATLQDKVEPACGRLRTALQPLLVAAAYRPLVPEELLGAVEAHHEAQVCLAQAAAQLVQLRAGEQELAAQLAGMEEKAAGLA